MPSPRGQMTGLLSPFLERQRIAQASAFLADRRRVLDVGCGRARLLAHLHPECRYVGVDRRADVIDDLRVVHPRHTFVVADVEAGAIAMDDQSFDAIVMLAVVEHLAAPAATLRRMASLLSRNGILVMTTPHPRAEPIHALGARMGLFSQEAAEEHTTTVDSRGMQRLAAECGLQVRLSRRFQWGLNQTFVLARSAS